MLNSSSSLPQAPDLSAAATQQNNTYQTVANQATTANRPNQNTSFASSSWTQDPTTGQWTQNVNLTGAAGTLNQGATNLAQSAVDGLSQQVDYGSAPQSWNLQQQTASNFSPTSNYSQAGADAYLARSQANLDRSQAAEQARLKAQGITEGSDAWTSAMETQGQQRNDLNSQAIMYGSQLGQQQFAQDLSTFNANQSAQNQAFNNNLSGAGYTLNQRQQNLAEQQQQRMQGVTDVQSLMNGLSGYQSMPTFAQAQTPQVSDSVDALSKNYNNSVNAWNASQARQSTDQSNMVNLLSGLLGGAAGSSGYGNLGSAITGLLGGKPSTGGSSGSSGSSGTSSGLGGLLSGAGSWLQNYFTDGSQSSNSPSYDNPYYTPTPGQMSSWQQGLNNLIGDNYSNPNYDSSQELTDQSWLWS